MNTKKIIDLTQPIYDGMPVYPGDPEVSIKPVFTVEKDEWAVSRIEMVSHDATHVNVPRHIKTDGKHLSAYNVSDFICQARVFKSVDDITSGTGYIFDDQNITMQIAEVLVSKDVKLVALSDKFDFDLAVERFLLEKNVISFEKLANTDQLPKGATFTFYGIPLLIKEGDGAPCRAFAEV